MNYELAKKLKGAGFPFGWQTVVSCDGGVQCSSKKCLGKHSEPYLNEEQRKRALTENTPTLEELIEACGKSFLVLRNGLAEASVPAVWVAGGRRAVHTEYIDTIGSTPLEAVAKLWIKLQESNNSATLKRES